MAERNERGQFAKGHGGGGKRVGSGRKPSEVTRTLQQLLDAAVTDEDWIDIFRAQADMAKQGDTKAAAFLVDRKFGKPKETVEVQDNSTSIVPLRIILNTPDASH